MVTADAGYDSEANHEAGRDGAGERTLIPPLIGRPSDKAPAGRHRAMMKRQLKRRDVRATYGQRWQVETVNSVMKRNLGSALRARTQHRRSMELLLRSVVHNVMMLEGTEDRDRARQTTIRGRPGPMRRMLGTRPTNTAYAIRQCGAGEESATTPQSRIHRCWKSGKLLTASSA